MPQAFKFPLARSFTRKCDGERKASWSIHIQGCKELSYVIIFHSYLQLWRLLEHMIYFLSILLSLCSPPLLNRWFDKVEELFILRVGRRSLTFFILGEISRLNLSLRNRRTYSKGKQTREGRYRKENDTEPSEAAKNKHSVITIHVQRPLKWLE